MTTDQRVTETRTEVRVEEVEDTKFECAVCEMVYESEKVLTVGLDRNPQEAERMFAVRQPEVERIICTHCAEGLFDYTTEDGWTPERSGVLPGQFVERLTAYAVTAMFVSLPVGILVFALAGAGIPATSAAMYGLVALGITLILAVVL